ncbi:MAG: KpsF/GutQ family sugar-phosphate isomerase [Kofleriaceae bacterium]
MASDSPAIAVVRQPGERAETARPVAVVAPARRTGVGPAISPGSAGAIEHARGGLLAQASASPPSPTASTATSRRPRLILATEGRVAIVGVGKSGIVGRKIASTLSSTGTPAVFVNAAEARHGDLGMITPRDLAILVTYSGETDEVTALLPHLRALDLPLIAIVGNPASTVGRAADVVLDVSVASETCPNNLAPTTSTLATMAMGDALAVGLMRERNFGADDFRRTHPGGSLGRKLGARVRDAMHRPPLPVVPPSATVAESLEIMSEGQLGLVLVTSGERLIGLVTDGDLRRAMQRSLAAAEDVGSLCVAEFMTRNPVTVTEDTLLGDAHARMQAMKLKALVVLGEGGKVAGVVEIFDLGQ